MLVIILGRSASGKTTVVNNLVSKGIGTNLVTYTTRKIRPSEVEGLDYFFVTPSQFNTIEIIDTFVVNENWKYGVSLEELKKDKVQFFSVISPSYALSIAKNAKRHGIKTYVIVFDISKEERLKRLKERGETEEAILQRFEIEKNEGEILPDNFSSFNLKVIKDSSLSVNEISSEIDIFLKNN